MEWPEFDFSKNPRETPTTCKLKGRPKSCHSLAVGSENIKSRRKRNSTQRNTTLNENNITIYRPLLRYNNSTDYVRGDCFLMSRRIDTNNVPPLSPVLVNGFLRNPASYSPTLLRNPNLNEDRVMKSKHINRLNPLAVSENPTIVESSQLLSTLPKSEQLALSGENPVFSFQKSMEMPRGQSSQLVLNNSVVSATKEYSDSNSKSGKNDKNANNSIKLHASLSPSTNASHSLDISLTSLEALLLSKTDSKTSDKSESFPILDFINSQSVFESSSSQLVRIDNDISQNHDVNVDDPGDVCSTSQKSLDCFFDVTIHEIQPNDPDFDTELIEQRSSSETNQLNKCHFENAIGESVHQKQHHRLSKLAETLKKRLFISSSDLVMWKCEKPKQKPVRRVTVISNVEQWGFCWTLVRDVSDSKIIHVVDSEPMMKRNVGGDREDRGCCDSAQRTLEKTFCFYQPLSKLNTSASEFILSPRYYL